MRYVFCPKNTAEKECDFTRCKKSTRGGIRVLGNIFKYTVRILVQIKHFSNTKLVSNDDHKLVQNVEQ